MKFKVTVEEFASKEVIIEAKDEIEAETKVREMYEEGEIVLDYKDVYEFNINGTVKEEENE